MAFNVQMFGVLLGMVSFGVAAAAAIAGGRYLTRGVMPFDDGPPPGKPPVPFIIAEAVIVGGLLGLHGSAWPYVLAAAVVIGCMSGCWYCDVALGIIPDALTLVPLAGILIFALFVRNWGTLISACVLFLPFAISAWRSKGLGMGWGDAKLAALAGALLGTEGAIVATMFSCIVAMIYAKITRRGNVPIAFAPFLVVAYEAVLPFNFS